MYILMTKGDYSDHLTKLEEVFCHLAATNLKINAEKSFFAKPELEYLGFWITRNGIRPLMKKVEAMQNLTAPKTHKELHRFIGLVNYY